MARLKMVWLPLRKWISFLPVAFIIYILLQYLVYQPELRAASSERSTFVGEAKLLNLTNSLQNVEDPQTPLVALANGSDPKSAQSDAFNGAKENSISYSSSTVEKSVSASVSSSKGKPPAEVPPAPEPARSPSNGRVLSGTNIDAAKPDANMDAPKPDNNLDAAKPDTHVDTAKPNTNWQTEKDPSSKDPLENSQNGVAPNSKPKTPASKDQTSDKKQINIKNPPGRRKPNNKNVLKETISKKHRKPPKHKYAIEYLHGNTKVGDIYDKGYMVPQEELCPNNGRDLRVLIFVTTAPDHEHHRNAIRQTWGHFAMRKDVSIGFLVGRSDKSEAQNIIDRENDRYGDIIQSNFIDVYANLTLKTVSMFEWLNTYCSEVRFVLKTDDDMYINVPLLLAYIYTKRNDQRAIYGRLARNWKPVRNKKSKYYISKETYSTIKYPDFLTGPAYLFTNDIVEDLYAKALDSIFFKLEDVFTTGLVAESLNIKRVGDSHFRNEKISLKDTCKLMQTISIHMVKYEEEFDIYKRTLDGKTKCRIK